MIQKLINFNNQGKQNNMLDNRFWQKVDKIGSCWKWMSVISNSGYGQFSINGKHQLAHRVSYEDKHGKIPQGLVINHICKNRDCVNPDHLESITQKVNCQKGETGQYQRLKTHCPYNHEYTKENTYINSKGHRSCRICERFRKRISYHQKNRRN